MNNVGRAILGGLVTLVGLAVVARTERDQSGRAAKRRMASPGEKIEVITTARFMGHLIL